MILLLIIIVILLLGSGGWFYNSRNTGPVMPGAAYTAPSGPYNLIWLVVVVVVLLSLFGHFGGHYY